MRHQGKALVLGDDTRSFLAIVRSLGRAGIAVHAAPADFTTPALRSRYIAAVHWLPPYLGDGAEWCNEVSALLRREAFDLVIPCDERTLLPLDHHRAEFAGLSRLALPDPPAIEVLFDKEKTRQLAIAQGVPVAPGRSLRPDDTAAPLIAEFGLPLVLKPRQSYRMATLHARARASIHASEASLAAALAELGEVPHLVESCFPGFGAGVSILASRGTVLQAFQHSRARERAGAGYYRVSRPLSPEYVDAVQRLSVALEFTGVAMVELKVDPGSGQWILLEVNARPWGSLPLPVALGVDFPLRWYRLLVDGEVIPAADYRAGVYGRNLLPDVRQILAEVHDLRRTPLAMLRHLLVAAAQFGRLVIGREHLDVLVADDPRPGLSELRRAGGEALRRLVERLPGRRLLGRRQDRAALQRLLRSMHDRPVTVTMLCQGNTCRSPFAAELLRRRLADRAPRISIHSAGMLPREGAPSPPEAITAAHARGIDLSRHRSAHFSRQAAEATTVVVIFDQRNRYALAARYPALLKRTIMLGSLLPADDGRREINDPDGGDLATFERTYAAITVAVGELATAIDQALRP